MKRFILFISFVAVVAVSFSSCAASKRDCNGVKHTRLKNGIYL